MKNSLGHYLAAGMLAAAALPFASPATAGAVSCGYYRPGLFTYMAVRPAPCVYQGDYMVQQWASYDGPALIAPQPTYSPSPTVAGYVHGPYRTAPVVVRRATVTRVRYAGVNGPVVSVRNDLPRSNGKVEIVRARAEVRIYGRQRMDIRLYRH